MILSKNEKSIFDSMLALGMTEEEAFEAIEDDRRIDKGEKLFDLPPELEKGAKKARRADRKPNSKPTNRERKEDIDKRTLIQILVNALAKNEISEHEVTNPERQIDFIFHGRKFRIVLSAPRTQSFGHFA